MTMITPSYLGETIEYSSLHACRSTLEDPTRDVLFAFGAGLSQMGMDVDEPRQQPGSGSLDEAHSVLGAHEACSGVSTDAGDPSSFDHHVHLIGGFEPRRGVDWPDTAENERACHEPGGPRIASPGRVVERMPGLRERSLTIRGARASPACPRERGGIGRRTRFRFWRRNWREGSTPSVRTPVRRGRRTGRRSFGFPGLRPAALDCVQERATPSVRTPVRRGRRTGRRSHPCPSRTRLRVAAGAVIRRASTPINLDYRSTHSHAPPQVATARA